MSYTSIDLDPAIRSQVIGLLQARLFDVVDLFTQVKQAHWNVKGPSFIALHELFDRVAEIVEEQGDEIAERIVALGGTALGSARAAAARSNLAEYPPDLSDGAAHVAALAERMAGFGRDVRGDIDRAAAAGDAGTADLFTGVSREIDKQLWFIEAHGRASS